jgi:hypothetical protein
MTYRVLWSTRLHLQAVAGLVGIAESLGVVTCIPAILAYMAAAEAQLPGPSASRRERWLAALHHWGLVAAAILLSWVSALAKEVGITARESARAG